MPQPQGSHAEKPGISGTLEQKGTATDRWSGASKNPIEMTSQQGASNQSDAPEAVSNHSPTTQRVLPGSPNSPRRMVTEADQQALPGVSLESARSLSPPVGLRCTDFDRLFLMLGHLINPE